MSPKSLLIVTPAKAGVHAATNVVVDKWTPAFAGVTILQLGSSVSEP
jgi:hypothetical protein